MLRCAPHHSPARLQREVAEQQDAAVNRLLDERRLEVGHGGLVVVDELPDPSLHSHPLGLGTSTVEIGPISGVQLAR